MKGKTYSWNWDSDREGTFVVSQLYEKLHNIVALDDENFYNTSWKIPIPLGLKGFMWELVLSKLQTKENLLRNIIIGASNAECTFYHTHLESATHLIFDCDLALEMWRRCYWWFADIRVLLMDVRTHFWQHSGSMIGKKQKWSWWLLWIVTT